MIKWTQEQLERNGYKMINMCIKSANISMREHGVAELSMLIEGSGCGCIYGGYVIGHGYLGAENFSGSDMGMESILRIMDTVGVETFNDLKGKYIRAATKGWGDSIKIIGNILEDKWFDIESFFKDKVECAQNDERIKKIDNWTPCSERNPDSSGEYIVTIETRGGSHYTDNKEYRGYLKSQNRWIVESKDLKVVAWMPKPEPWEGETK